DLEEGVVDNDKNGKPDYLDPQLFVPEIFSPNGDGINEYLIIRGLNNFPNATIKVFNQWGQIVFDSKGPYENNWSGDYRPEGSSNIGAVLSEGVYFYIVNYNQATANTQKIIKGNIYIKP
ncbi:MAG: gliding motility-associated C-terminal domain-containing protein, partial [Saprospiraceae bacterium]|nr:gliding motility-associated C-terminal domain-containing protein [Saprospiraceae bacterium]